MMEIILFFYCVAAALLTVYGINCHVMIYLFKRHFKRCKAEEQRRLQDFYRDQQGKEWPMVTTQLPIYNELNVAERVIDAVAAFDYPKGRHEIQVLDDSTDETCQIIAQKVKALQQAGVLIEHIRRSDRTGYKAGALRNGLSKAKGEFMAIFDADFAPPRDFLLKSIPFFVMDPTVGLVQGRWGHLNDDDSLVTRLQSIGINGHFIIEQSARTWGNLFMNFNGTGGLFRKEAILSAGNWQDDTLTEDLDLSYRIQLAGWRCRYLLDLVSPAEIPKDINAFKSQQFRWAKGSIQSAIKLLWRVWKSDSGLFKKLQATLHLTHYIVHPLMVYLAIMAVPLLLVDRHHELPPMVLILVGCLLVLGSTGPSRMYWTAENFQFKGWSKRTLLLPFLACFGSGLAINNAKAVLEALWGKKSHFIRTPKHGNTQKKNYKTAPNRLFAVEILTGLWCLSGVFLYVRAGHYLIGNFLLIYAVGFLFMGLLSFQHQRRAV